MAISIVTLIGIAALVIDVGRLYVAKQRAQNVADAAAIAGAWLLNGTTACEPTVETESQTVANANNASTDFWKVQPTAGGETVTVTFPTSIQRADGTTTPVNEGDAVRVDCKVNVNYGFAKIFGLLNSAPSATAIATRLISYKYPFAPWVVSEDTIENTSPGTEEVLKVVNNQDSFLGGGNFQCVAYQGDSGGRDYRDRIAGDGAPIEVGIGDFALETEPGNMIGPTFQGLRDRLADSAYTDDATAYTSWLASADADGTYDYDSRIVMVPVVENVDVNGRNELTVVGFAAFFIESFDKDTGDVTGRFISATDVGGLLTWGLSDFGAGFTVKGVSLVR